MPGHEFFERQLPRFALQARAAKTAEDRQTNAELLISKAEYECMQMRRDLMAAFAVPLSQRAVEGPEVEAPEPVVEAVPAHGAAKAA